MFTVLLHGKQHNDHFENLFQHFHQKLDFSLVFTFMIIMRSSAFYAVARGRCVGVYRSWAECQANVNGFAGAIFKKFPSNAEALTYIQQHEDTNGLKANAIRKSAIKTWKAPLPSPHQQSSSRETGPNCCANAVVVYTDGACSGNGQRRAKAGYGVFWGVDHPDNVSAPIGDGPQTNNRAEYMAVIAALERARERCIARLVIRTDSNLLIQSMTKWLRKWRTNGWKTVDGGDVRNRDLLERISGLQDALPDVRFEKVEGHSGDFGNDQADALARRGAEKN